ncbi:hypothetical protein LAZ67_6003297 [Cordylochernes scorpioides]|uniref:Reverse transcriptase n=1 Tax=Cordylochernes scorpioides TaxID=51811 RepID=A0ABY6KLW0_9ARAC|nr:hypothetical protein LAZ67_6003297 [Cordylochernes scorpioides]
MEDLIRRKKYAGVKMPKDVSNVTLAESPKRAAHEPERLSSKSSTSAETSAKIAFQKNSSEENQEKTKHANPPAGDVHVNPAAARDVTAPPTAASSSAATASPASLNWADSEMVDVDDNGGFTVVKNKKRRRTSTTPEHAAKQPSRPAEKPSSQQLRRPTGPKTVPPREIKATRANIADAKKRQATTDHEHYIFAVGGPDKITHFGKMNGHFLVGLATKDLARLLVESDLEIGGTTLRVFPYRKRAERIVVAGLPGFVDDFTIVNALGQYGRVTSIAPILIKLGEFAFNDGRREAFILLHEGVRLETLPARLTIQSKGDTLSAYLSFGIKCSKCGRQGHRRASCPSLARRNFDAPKRVDNPAQVQASPSPPVPKRTGPPTPVSSPPAPPAPSEEAPNNAPVTPAAAAPGAPALHPARPLLPPGEAPSSTCSASNPPTTPALPSPAPRRANGGPALPPSRDIIIGFTIASINARGLAIRNKSLSLCHLLRQNRVDIALVQETNTHHLDGAQDLCLGYDAITAPPDAISGSGLACIYAPGITVSRHRILWPGHIVLATLNVHGQEMTVINVHLSHDQRERIEQLRVIEAAAVEEEEEAWVLGDFNIRDDRNRDSISMAALGALCESAALLDAAPEFDAAHLPTRVAAHGDLIESSRLDRILAPARFPEVSTSYAIAPFHLSDHRLVLLRVGPPAAPYQPRVAATLRSGLAQEHMNNYLVDIAEEISMLDAPQLWNRWTLIKAGILAEARSLHDPRHHDRDDSYIGRAQRYIRVQLEASSTNADYPSLSDLARLTRHRRPAVTTIRDENGEVIEGPALRRKALDIFRPRFARPSCDPAEYAAFIGATTTTPIELGEEDPLHRAEVSEAEHFEEFFAVALRRVLAESQLRGALPPSMRRSEICLVPKARGGDRGLDGYRPISLPSADYRVIGSILLGRLRPHLPTLVPECQTYAVPGRSPSWNIARVTDAVEEATARGTPLAAVSVDLQSAFDSLDRGYLTPLLVSHLRLPPAFVGWILLLYAGADATIRVGGFQTVAFRLLNGVRQGCALSAALFSIATGPLLRRLETILGVGNVIAYADDIVLLIHRDEQFARAAAIFESFHRASGIAVNYSKSAGLWCGAWRDRGDSPLRGASWSNSSIQVLGTRIATRSSVVQREQHLLALLESACRRTTPFTRGLSLVGRARAANSLVLSTIQHHLHAYLPEASIISKLQACVARFIWGPDHTAWLASCILARPVVSRSRFEGGRNGFSWLVTSEAWLRPPPDGTTLQPRRFRLLKLWEETSSVLSLDHRAAPTTQLLDLPIIGGFRFLRPPNLLAPSRWVGARVRDLGDDDHHTIVIPHPTRSALADAAALAAFCRRIVAENIQASYRVPSLAEAVVLRGTTKPLAHITTRSARRALDRPRLAALPIHRLLARWTPTVDVPPRVDWTSLRRGALSGHNADVALRLALHALPHPDHPASAGPSCPACGSSDGSLGHRYWGCRTIRPLILEAFNIIGRPPDLQAWIFGTGLEQDDISILSSAKSRVYRHFIQKSPKNSLQKKTSEENSANQKHANSPAGDVHVNPAAACDVTAPPTAASSSENPPDPASLNWADSEMAGVGANDDFIVVKGKKRRRGSTSTEHSARQPNKPGDQRSSQQRKRPTGPRAVPPQEINATRANIAAARARQTSSTHENYVFVELCPDIPDYSYLRAMSRLFGGPGGITQFNKMNSHYIVGLETKDLARRLVEGGLEIEGTTLRVFPYRKRAERIIIANLPGFVEDRTVVNALGPYGKVTSLLLWLPRGPSSPRSFRSTSRCRRRSGPQLPPRLPRENPHSSSCRSTSSSPPTSPSTGTGCPETNAFHLGSGQDLCLGYNAVILAHPVAISGSGLACVFGPGVAVLQQRILWPGHIALATIDVHGEEMTAIAVHLAHEPRERNRQLELLAATAAQEEEGACWIIGDFNIRDRGPSSSSSSDALAALLDLAALVDVATQFDAAHLPTRVAMHGDQVESNRLDRILVPAGVLDRVSIYATSHYHLSDHRLVLLQVGPPTTAVSFPTQPRLAAKLRSGLALEHLAGYIRELEEGTAHDDDDGTFWDRWTSIKAGLLAEARSLHDPRHAASDSCVYRARRYIAAQLEASSIRADYPSLPDLARAIRLRRPVSVIRDEQDNIIEGPELRRRAFATFQPRFARPTRDPAAGAAFIASSAPTTTRELSLRRRHRPPIPSRRRLRTGGDRLRGVQAGLRGWREPPEERWPLVRRLAQPRRLPSRRLLVDHLHQHPRARHRPQEHRRPPGAASPGPPGDCVPQMDALHPRPLPRRTSKSGEHAGGVHDPAPPAWIPPITPDHRQTAGPTGELQLACLKGVQVALRGGRNAFSWLVESGEAWIHLPPDGTRLQPRRLRLLKLWEEASNILSLNHRALPTAQLLDLPIIGGCRFLRPPDLLAPARWRGARVRDLIVEENLIARPTRSALADAAALGAFCRRLTSENAVGFGAESTPSSSSLAAAVVLRGTAKPFLNGLTTRSARRALDRPRLAATPISRFLARWTPTINPPSRIDWASLRRCAYSSHEALKLALHALPHPAHPASVGPSCPACGSIDRSLGHRYWCCRSIRPLIREAFNIIGRPPDLQAWIFGGSGLENDALSILASAKLRIYRYFVQVGLGEAVEDTLIAWSRTLQRRGFLLSPPL